MSRIKRWLDDVYYKKILEGKTQELIDEGMSREEIDEIRQMYEEAEGLN